MKKYKKQISGPGITYSIVSRKNIIKICASGVAIALSASMTLTSVADEVTYVKESPEMVNAPTESSQKVTAEASSCADINNPLGLGYAQAMAVNDMKTMIATPINTDKMFDPGRAGCFDALKDFPNLSVTIPSLTDIGNALQKALVKYATRKVCNTVNEALTEMITPINEVLDQVSENGQIDLTGTVNKQIYKELYEVDPALGRQMTSAESSYEWQSPTWEEMAASSKGIIADNGSNTGSETGFTEPTAPKQPLIENAAVQQEEAPKKSLAESAKAVIANIF